ncbi:MAG TPA: hypothetical protein VMW36_03245 [Patescibacteria group bacterium]|nr:hypothetical protein [Patescibacteria group bacterium]
MAKKKNDRMTKVVDVPEGMADRIKEMAMQTWQVIASDIFQCMEEAGEPLEMTKDHVVEVVCDADHMMYNGRDKEAYEWWKSLNYSDQAHELVEAAFTCDTYV